MDIEKLARGVMVILPPVLTYFLIDKILKELDPAFIGATLAMLLGVLLISVTVGPLIFFLVKDRQKDKDQFLEGLSKRKPGKYSFR
jgi:hypothetical protein